MSKFHYTITVTITGAYEGGHWVHVYPLGGHEWEDSFIKWFYIMWGKNYKFDIKRHFILFQYFSNIKRQLFHHFEFSLLKNSAITTLKFFWYSAQTNLILISCKNVMQGKLIAVAYTLRTYWNQFTLGGICKQE